MDDLLASLYGTGMGRAFELVLRWLIYSVALASGSVLGSEDVM